MAQHKHAELMALFAEDARVSETPWMFWQRRPIEPNGCNWIDCANSPTWQTDYEYRRKPRTIRIGEFDVPEPMREAPKEGSSYFIPATDAVRILAHESHWDCDDIDYGRLLRGICHATHVGAALHAIALISLTCTTERLAELKKLL